MKSQICLIRHGITEGNKLKVFYGGVDIPLLDEGVEALRQQVADDIYPHFEDAEYYTTGMIRTEQTFEIIYGNREHEKLPMLREINFGEYEMKHYRDLKADPEFQAWYRDASGVSEPPGGESIANFKQRILGGFEELKVRHFEQVLRLRNREKMAASVVVCHAGPICAILDSCWPDTHSNFFGWAPEPGHGYLITFEDGAVVEYETF